MTLTVNFLEKLLAEILQNSENVNGLFEINNKKFDLRVTGKTTCPKAFAALYGVSLNTICNIIDKAEAPIEVAEPVSTNHLLLILLIEF